MERVLKIRKLGDGSSIIEDSLYGEDEYRAFDANQRFDLQDHISAKLNEMYPAAAPDTEIDGEAPVDPTPAPSPEPGPSMDVEQPGSETVVEEGPQPG